MTKSISNTARSVRSNPYHFFYIRLRFILMHPLLFPPQRFFSCHVLWQRCKANGLKCKECQITSYCQGWLCTVKHVYLGNLKMSFMRSKLTSKLTVTTLSYAVKKIRNKTLYITAQHNISNLLVQCFNAVFTEIEKIMRKSHK